MATVGRPPRGGGGGRGGGQGGGGGRGGGEMGNQRRGSWRGGPPGGMGHNARGGSPVGGGGQPGGPGGPNAPRVSINDHMSEMKKVQVEKPAMNKVLQTDTDISGPARSSPGPRELQPWTAPDNGPNGTVNGTSTPKGRGGKDTETFGTDDKSGAKWDQFATNARLFGTTTSYQEEIYTTKLDKGGSDFRAKEREAERLAREIMGQSSTNMHVNEERNVSTDWADLKDDEEKYSGVQRDQPAAPPPPQRGPNAYVPPAARKSQGGGAGYAAAAGKGVPAPAPSAGGKGNTAANGNGPSPAPGAANASKAPTPASAKSTAPTPSAAPTPATKPAVGGAATAAPGDGTAPPPATSPLPAGAASASPSVPTAALDAKDSLKVVNAYRQFVDDEKGRVEAKKQAMAKTERERQLADLKSFQATFKVPLPIPKDILPILSKDEDKQKTIEKNAQVSLQAAKEAKLKSPSPNAAAAKALPADMARAVSSATKPPAPTSAAAPKKISMHIAEIPAFKSGARKPSMNAGTGPLPISDSAKTDIPISSPTLSATASQAAEQAKLNPKAAAFVFKPTAAAFRPGQASAGVSPASRPSLPSALAGPSVPKNPFFGDVVPGRTTVDLRSDFNPFRHCGERGVIPAHQVAPNWPYTGRPVQMSFMQPGHPIFGMEDEMTSPQFRQPQLMPGMQGGWYPPNRFGQPGMPPQQGQPGMPPNPMFSPVGPGYIPLPGMPQHMLNGPQGHQSTHPQHPQPQHQHPNHQHPNHQQQMQHQQQGQGQGHHPQHPQHPGMPMYFPPNGMPGNPQFLPQHMQQPFNPANPGPNGAGMPHSPQSRPGVPQGQGPGQPGQGQPGGLPPGPGPGHGQGPGSQGQGQGQGGPQGMYYAQQGQIPTPHHTPQNQGQHILPFPPPPPGSTPHPPPPPPQQFQGSPMMLPQMTGQMPPQGQGRRPSVGFEQGHMQQPGQGGPGGA